MDGAPHVGGPELDAPAITMTVRWTREQLLGYIGTWSATVKLVAARGDGQVRALHDALAAVWPDGEVRTIRWPLALRLALKFAP